MCDYLNNDTDNTYQADQKNWASNMKNNTTLTLFLIILLFTGTSWATTPQLGEWELLFGNDDGRAVALDVYHETPVILDAQGYIYFVNKEIGKESSGEWFSEVFESWQRVPGGGEAIDVSIDGDGVPWVVSRNTYKIYHLNGPIEGDLSANSHHGWVEHPGNGKARKISVSKTNGTPYIIGAVSGRVYKGTSTGWTALSDKLLDSSGQTLNIPLNALDLFAESFNTGNSEKPELRDLVFAINQDKRVFLYVTEQEAWLELPGNARATSVVASGKLVYIVGEDSKFYGLDLTSDKEWIPAGPGTGKDLAFSQVEIFQPFISQNGNKAPSSSHRHVWTINEKGQVYRAFVAF